MDKKSIFPLINQIALRLLFKVAIFCGALILLFFTQLSWWSIVIFLIAVLIIYASELPQSRLLKISFFLTALIGFTASCFLNRLLFGNVFLYGLAVTVVLSFMLFIILGAVSFLKNYLSAYRVLNTIILFLISLLVFYAKMVFALSPAYGQWIFPWWLAVILFISLIFLFKETFSFLGVSLSKKIWQISFVIGLLAVEIGWILMFLPLGFVNAAIFLTLFLILVRDGIALHFLGFFNRNIFFYELTFFVILAIAIFATTSWDI
ncbi:MAG: hypothetical protein QMD65_03260 [Patescibacteria group bacterium]|nr:hypothetical protein [Patescibacteria group bacterium]